MWKLELEEKLRRTGQKSFELRREREREKGRQREKGEKGDRERWDRVR